MPSIRFHCPNGHALQVEGALAGQQGKCPQCGRVVRVPPPNAGSEPPADETAATPPPPPPAAAPPTAPTERAVWYLRTNAGDQFGPATDAALRQWIMGGRVGHASYVWREGWAEWRTAADASEELPAPLPPQAPPAARGDPNREGSAAARYARRKRKNTVARSVVACVLLVLTMCLGGLLLYLLVSEQAKPVERDEDARQPAGAAVAPPAAPPDADAKPNAPGSAEAERGQRGAAGDRGGTGAAADDQADGPPNDDPFGLGDPFGLDN